MDIKKFNRSIFMMCILLCSSAPSVLAMRHLAQRARQTIARHAIHVRAWVNYAAHKTATSFKKITKNPVHARSLAALGVSPVIFWPVYRDKPTIFQKITRNKEQPIASLWYARARGDKLSRKQMIDLYRADCKKNEHLNNNIPMHTMNDKKIRVATYNVHSWRDAHGRYSMTEILKVISNINADVLVLQEVDICNNRTLHKTFADLGYHYQSFCRANSSWKCSFGNIVLSKYPFAQEAQKITYAEDKKYKGEQRCYVKATIQLPANKTITVYGTHFDVHDATENRRDKEAQELVNDSSSVENCLIAADCNAVRPSDYMYTVNNKSVWQLLDENHKERTGKPTPTKAFETLSASFIDSFTKHKQPTPRFTVWTGTTVDFLLLNRTWNLRTLGSHVYISHASDHCPVLSDFSLE